MRSHSSGRWSAIQINLDLAEVRTDARKARQAVDDASAVVVQTLERLCEPGHAMVSESTVLMHAEPQSRFDGETLFEGLRRAIRQRKIARERICDVECLFPRAVRDAELTVARCARQLAEGPPLLRGRNSSLEKMSLVCSSAPLATVDAMRRLLIRLNGANCYPLVQGADAAQWYRWRLGHAVAESGQWLSEHYRHARDTDTPCSNRPMFVLLDASRLGLESMAAILEAIPSAAALMLIGDLREGPATGHGQPFRDLASTTLFQCVRIADNNSRGERAGAIAPARRSALWWRLRRGASLSSNLRWGPITTIKLDGRDI